jgi:hypothetical protein
MKNLILSLAAALVIMTGFTSCKLMSDLFGEDTVVTTPSQLVEGAEMEPVTLPASVVGELPEGTQLVLADRKDLIEEGAYVPFSPGEGDVPGILDALIGLGSTFIPGLAAWEGVLTLISRRKRKNYAKAIKAMVPTDSNVDIAGTLHGIAAAIGVSHTSEASEMAVMEEEEELV